MEAVRATVGRFSLSARRRCGAAGSKPRSRHVARGLHSHAGPDEEDMALPLHAQLAARGIRTFVDKKSLQPGDRGKEVMRAAMRTARVGVFILSPEFAGARGLCES